MDRKAALITASLPEAMRRSRENPRSRMLGRSAANHAEPECWPVWSPGFEIEPGATIFTAGCCFVRNVERMLARHGFRLPTSEMQIPHLPAGDPAFSRVLVKSTPYSLLRELRWAHDILHRDDQVRDEDITPLLLPAGNKAIDLHLTDYRPIPVSHALERRRGVYRVFREAFFSDLLFLAYASIEEWLDRQSGLYLTRVPFPQMDEEGGRFCFEMLSYSSCVEALTETVDLLSAESGTTVVLSVSPIVQKLTFTDSDVIVANNYSKSVLVAAIGEVAATYRQAEYFPAYEMAILTRQPYVWTDDLRHVSPAFVGRIVNRFVQACERGADRQDLSLPLEHQLRLLTFVTGGMMEEAMIEFRALADPVAVPNGAFQAACARLMLHRGNREATRTHLYALTRRDVPAGAVAILDVVNELDDADVTGAVQDWLVACGCAQPGRLLGIIRALRTRERYEEARDLSVRATDACPDQAEFWLVLNDIATQMGDESIMRQTLSRLVDLEPGDAATCFQVGETLAAGGRAAEAVAKLERAVELEGENQDYYAALGRLRDRVEATAEL